MKVCFVSHTSGKGGAEWALVELLEALADRDVERHVVVPRAGPLLNEMDRLGVPHAIVAYPWWVAGQQSVLGRARRAVGTMRAARRLARMVRNQHIDVVYSNTIAIGAGALGAWLAGRPHVWHIHEFGYEDHGLYFDIGERLGPRMIGRLSQACVVNSQAVKAKYAQFIPADKLHVVYYSVDADGDRWTTESVQSGSARDRKLHCVLVGSLAPGKGQMDAIRAVYQLAEQGIDVELDLVGPEVGDYAQRLAEAVAATHLQDRVHFVGYVDDPSPYFAAADVVLMCSPSEAFGRVTVEAMRAGKPVVGARGGGTIELVRDGFNGLLYEPGDDAQLAEKIALLNDDRGSARAMGARGREWASRQFTPERYAAGVLTVLENAAGMG